MNHLTAREADVIRLVACGGTCSQIGRAAG